MHHEPDINVLDLLNNQKCPGGEKYKEILLEIEQGTPKRQISSQ